MGEKRGPTTPGWVGNPFEAMDGRHYGVIYADPPWSFSSRQFTQAGTPGSPAKFESLEETAYGTMATDDICALPVADISAEDAALFMWTTDAHLPDALRVMAAWGFTYKTVGFIWRKMRENGRECARVGHWTMKQAELCLFGTRGAMRQYKRTNNIKQMVTAPVGRHSEKPAKVAAQIETLFGGLPRLELFARSPRPGWDVWGNELKGD